jgi:hypothetical protein
VDEEEYFQTLPDNTTLMLLFKDDMWSPYGPPYTWVYYTFYTRKMNDLVYTSLIFARVVMKTVPRSKALGVQKGFICNVTKSDTNVVPRI